MVDGKSLTLGYKWESELLEPGYMIAADLAEINHLSPIGAVGIFKKEGDIITVVRLEQFTNMEDYKKIVKEMIKQYGNVTQI